MDYMKLLFIISTLIRFLSGQSFSFDVLNTNSVVRCNIEIPSNYTNSYSYEFTDVGGIGITYVYEYSNGAILYISNGESLNASRINKQGQYDQKWIPLAANMWLLLYDGEGPIGRIEAKGRQCFRWWREIETPEICVGYYRVSKSQKSAFDKALDSLEIIRE